MTLCQQHRALEAHMTLCQQYRALEAHYIVPGPRTHGRDDREQDKAHGYRALLLSFSKLNNVVVIQQAKQVFHRP